jgi:transcriptional regulator with XRE-family HTH domain
MPRRKFGIIDAKCGGRSAISKREAGALYSLLRAKSGLTQKVFGERLGLNQPTVHNREHSRSVYSASELVFLARALHYTPTEFWKLLEAIANHPVL